MTFPTSGLVDNQVHKEGNRSFVYDSTLLVWDQVPEAPETISILGAGKVLDDVVLGGSVEIPAIGAKIVKAWAHFEGDGTPTLTSNLNVSSVVSGGSAGRYLVSFSPALGGTAAVVGGLCDDIDTYGGNRGICTSSDNSSVFDHCKITTFVCSTATEGDMGDISIVVFSA